MKYYIQDQESKLYIGSHWKTGFQLIEIDRAFVFNEEKAKSTLDFLVSFSNADLKIVEKPMKVSDYYPEEEAVGPHKKFMMFFTDDKAPWEGGNVEFGLEFIGCTMLCSTYNNMKRVLSTRPEVLEFREKWNKEITPEDLESFIKWYVKEVQKPDVSMSPYDDIFSAIALALDPFYETDKLAKEYIDMLAKCKGGKMKWIAGEIVKAHTQ
jgi:hypothetical protein